MRIFCFELLISNYLISQNGSVITLGNSSYGGDISCISSTTNKDVTKIFSTVKAFAALKNDATTLNTTIPFQNNNNSIEIEVENNATYFWKIVAYDANGKHSNSGVYAFRTN